LQPKQKQPDSLKKVDNYGKYRPIHWKIEQGLSQDDCRHIIKDVYGFLWMGSSHGLNRFDGTTNRIFYHDPSNPRSILSDEAGWGFCEDSLHNIWIGMPIGLTRYDIRADTFTNFVDSFRNYPFWSTKDEMLFIGNGSSTINAYNIHSLKRKTLATLGPYTGLFLGPSEHHSVLDESTNCVWLLISGQEKKIFGLLQVNLSNGSRQLFSWSCYRKIPDHNHSSEGMCYDKKRHSIWINSNDGLLQFTLSDKQFHHVDALDKLPKLKDYEKVFDHWVGIDIDKKNLIWVASVQKGIVAYDPDAEIAFQPLSYDSSLALDVSGRNATIYCDRDGIVWCGSWWKKGIYQLNPFSEAVETYVGDPSGPPGFNSSLTLINDIWKADHGKLWMGRNGGLNIFDPRTGTSEFLRMKDLPGIKGTDIVRVVIDTVSQKAWLGSNGYFEMDIGTKKCRPVMFKDSAGREFPFYGGGTNFGYKNGFITVNVWENYTHFGVYFVSSDSHIAQELFSLPFRVQGYYIMTLAQNDHLVFIKDYQNSFGNLSYSDIGGKWVLTHTPLDSVLWERIFYNKADDSYWVVTFQKLIHYDKNFHVISEYTTRNGFPEIPVASLIVDKHNNLWFNTDRSIYELNTKTGTILRLSEKDGFKPQNFSDYPSVAKDDDGDLYFAGGFFGNGFNRIDPDKFASPPSFVYLNSIRINDSLLPLSTGVNDLQTLSLKYFQNKITIETGVIDYYSKGKNQIRYKLEGLINEWQYAPSYYTIRFEGLRASSYKLIIQAASASNEFNGPEKILTIKISPPFWETWWFRTLGVILLIALVYAIVQYRSRNLRKRNVVLEEKVVHRTKELKLSLEELRMTQNQLIQQEKMASLGELTAGIAHEIQNPLNFVNNFSDVNRELAEELEEEIHKGNYDDATLLVRDIKQNEERINHHGKRAGAIVKGMLEHSKASSGQKEPTDINALAAEYLRLAYHGMQAKDKAFNVITRTEFDNSIGKINVNPQDIGRVILNLINNAFYAVNEKLMSGIANYEPTVSISTRLLKPPSGGQWFEIAVKDNGKGIPQKILDKIFQPFFTTKPTGQGTGLGLSLAYDIITKGYGGELKVETHEGEGSEFIILLPDSA
jgi:signal transduction histidine kinase/ligand-binding sensor domain-containing protein